LQKQLILVLRLVWVAGWLWRRYKVEQAEQPFFDMQKWELGFASIQTRFCKTSELGLSKTVNYHATPN
jgi:hypothetical protein